MLETLNEFFVINLIFLAISGQASDKSTDEINLYRARFQISGWSSDDAIACPCLPA